LSLSLRVSLACANSFHRGAPSVLRRPVRAVAPYITRATRITQYRTRFS